MPKTTKAQRAKHEKLIAAVEKLSDAVFAVVHPRNDVVFSECLRLAPPALVNAREAALAELWAFEAQLIDEGRAWRSATGATLFFN